MRSFVSISQSRCFSFQVPEPRLTEQRDIRFNLAIEMLFISGRMIPSRRIPRQNCFNLAIEMLFISGWVVSVRRLSPSLFQSRNRDAFHFRNYGFYCERCDTLIVSISQSRCFSFQGPISSSIAVLLYSSFNLAIEMLFISGAGVYYRGVCCAEFQSRNRDAFHFRSCVLATCASSSLSFNLAIEMLFISGARQNSAPSGNTVCFNLAIEMLFISGREGWRSLSPVSSLGFNLAIEMLFISGILIRWFRE